MIGSLAASLDRSGASRHNARRIARKGWLRQIADDARTVAQSLSTSTDVDLRQHGNHLRTLASGREVDRDRLLALACGGAIEAVRRRIGVTLFDTQVQAGLVVSLGGLAEMQTGEGKTLAMAIPAFYQSLGMRGVHIATPNEYLAQRDFEVMRGVMRPLGTTVAHAGQDMSPERRKKAYQADITYGAGPTFAFDYLRDQLSVESASNQRPGQSTLARLNGQSKTAMCLQRGLVATIVDEIDHGLIDDAISPLILSSPTTGQAPDADVHRAALQVASTLAAQDDFDVNPPAITLTDQGFDRVYDHHEMTVNESLMRPWHEYVVLALRAKYVYKRDRDYIVADDQIQIVDGTTGRIFEDRTWSGGLHQAIEAAQGLAIRPQSRALARMTRQRFYRRYEFLAGMTGTVAGCRREFEQIYGLPIHSVPVRVASSRKHLPLCISLDETEKTARIVDEVRQVIDAERAVLIGTQSIRHSQTIADALDRASIAHRVLNGVQDSDEASVIAEAGQPRAVTVATAMAGRGTDIRLHRSVRENGGLHVIVAEIHPIERVNRQLVGRSARCGDPGSCRRFVCAQESLLVDHAPWASRAIVRWHQSGRTAQPDLQPSLAKIHDDVQASQSRLRWNQLRADEQDQNLMTNVAEELSC